MYVSRWRQGQPRSYRGNCIHSRKNVSPYNVTANMKPIKSTPNVSVSSCVVAIASDVLVVELVELIVEGEDGRAWRYGGSWW